MCKNKLMDIIGKPDEQQVEQLSKFTLEYLDLNAELKDTAPQALSVPQICQCQLH